MLTLFPCFMPATPGHSSDEITLLKDDLDLPLWAWLLQKVAIVIIFKGLIA